MRRLILTLFGAVALAGCNESTGTALFGSVAVSFSTQGPATGVPAPPRAAAFDDTLTAGADTLIITSAQIVLREIELRRLEVTSCDTEPEPSGCEEVEVGPELIDLPLQPGVQTEFSISIPAGTYVEIEFDIHKVSDSDPADSAFIQTYPTMVDRSIRVTGTFNGQAFTYESDLNVEQELALVPALVLDETASTNVTILVDLDAWFRTAGGDLIDPATANKGLPNENQVRDNIIDSFEAFEDEDRDGDDSP